MHAYHIHIPPLMPLFVILACSPSASSRCPRPFCSFFALVLLPTFSHAPCCLLFSSWSLICRPAPRLHPCCKLAVPQVTTRKWSIIWWASAKVGNMTLCCCFFGNHFALCMLLGLVEAFCACCDAHEACPKRLTLCTTSHRRVHAHCACCSGGVVLNQASCDAGRLRHACSTGCSFHPLSYSLFYPDS